MESLSKRFRSMLGLSQKQASVLLVSIGVPTNIYKP